jgi:RHS repeat-associated protein
LNRLQSIVSSPSGANQPPLGYAYDYNDANQRTRVEWGDSSYWAYSYDALGQVTAGTKYFADGTPVPGQQFGYAFDDIGNRTNTTVGGDASGGNIRSATYTPNNLNQYSSRTVPSIIDILGIADPSATVTVNSASTDFRRGEYFQKRLTVANSSAPVWQSVSVNAGGTAQAGNVYAPKATESFTYDLDGNLTGDSRWTYAWDAENRLITMVANITNGPQRLDFEYDAQSRRIRKRVWPNTGGTGTPTSDTIFLYDGWNLVAELDGKNSDALIRTYQWGIDLSGSASGAGGIGGFVSVKPASGNGQFPCYDGNGNPIALVDSGTGLYSANYEYGPFGELTRITGSQATCPIRFSTRYYDDETDLLLYGFRTYSSSLGRWLTRDPRDEPGFRIFAASSKTQLAEFDRQSNRILRIGNSEVSGDLYSFVRNNPPNAVDPQGLYIRYTTTSGENTEVVNNYSDYNPYKSFYNTLTTLQDKSDQIVTLTISGHGGPTLICLDASSDYVMTATEQNISLGTEYDIKDLLNIVMACESIIYLNGCNTGSGPDNIAQEMSRALPGVIVAGQRKWCLGTSGWCGIEGLFEGGVVGRKAYYQYGQLIDKAWIFGP